MSILAHDRSHVRAAKAIDSSLLASPSRWSLDVHLRAAISRQDPLGGAPSSKRGALGRGVPTIDFSGDDGRPLAMRGLLRFIASPGFALTMPGTTDDLLDRGWLTGRDYGSVGRAAPGANALPRESRGVTPP